MVFSQGFVVEFGVAELYGTHVAMRQDMDGVEVIAAIEDLGDLFDAVPVLLENDHLDVAAGVILVEQFVDQRLVIFNASVDENDLMPPGVGFAVGRGDFRILDILFIQFLVSYLGIDQGGIDESLSSTGKQLPDLKFLEDESGLWI